MAWPSFRFRRSSQLYRLAAWMLAASAGLERSEEVLRGRLLRDPRDFGFAADVLDHLAGLRFLQAHAQDGVGVAEHRGRARAQGSLEA